jgi:O-antigen ligase
MRRLAETVIGWEWLILLVLLPFLLFPGGWRPLLLLVIPILWFLRKFGTGRFVPSTPFDAAVLLLLTALLISMAAVFNMAYSFQKISGLILGIALFYAAVQHTRTFEGGEFQLLAIILLAGSGMALAGLPSIIVLSGNQPINVLLEPLPAPILTLYEMLGTAVNPNEVAGVLGWLIPLLAATTVGFWRILWRSGRWSLRLVVFGMLFLLILNCAILLATRSRGGILSVGTALLFMVAIRFRWGKWLLILLSVGLIILGLYFDLGTILVGGVQGSDDFGLQGRLEIWSRALYGLADFPLTGMGMNGFRQVVHVLYPLFSISPTFDLGHAHNHLLQAGLDLGFLGLIAYLGLWLISGAVLWKSWKNFPRSIDRVLIIGLSGSLIAGWIFGIFDAIALGAKPGFLWWLLIGLLMATFDNIRSYSWK